jgi:hypothetical protein
VTSFLEAFAAGYQTACEKFGPGNSEVTNHILLYVCEYHRDKFFWKKLHFSSVRRFPWFYLQRISGICANSFEEAGSRISTMLTISEGLTKL